jgi:hemerythrin
MSFLEWKDSYNIGIKEIDNQHRGMFDLISKLSNTKQIYKNDKYFLATFEMFISYTRTHFKTEERYMIEANYEKLDEHKQEHDSFLDNLSEAIRRLRNEEPNIHQKLLDFLRDWYGSHILGTDRDYLDAFQKKGIK